MRTHIHIHISHHHHQRPATFIYTYMLTLRVLRFNHFAEVGNVYYLVGRVDIEAPVSITERLKSMLIACAVMSCLFSRFSTV